MSIRVLMTRRMPQLAGEMEADLLPQLGPLLTELRSMAMRQPGYISGETMRNVNDPAEYLVISTWKSVEDWQRWFADKRRKKLESEVALILGSNTEYKIYSYD